MILLVWLNSKDGALGYIRLTKWSYDKINYINVRLLNIQNRVKIVERGVNHEKTKDEKHKMFPIVEEMSKDINIMKSDFEGIIKILEDTIHKVH